MLGQEGTTEVAFQLLADGTLTGLTISKSSGSDRLDDAAVECVSKWHYRPAIKDGKLVDTPMKVSVAWKLDEGDADNKTGAAR